MTRKKTTITTLLICLFFMSCNHSRNVITSVTVQVPNYTEHRMIKLLRGILQNQGHEIKITGEDYLTTEWLQFANVDNSNPPFDFYIQLRMNVNNDNGKVIVTISPRIKEVNRLNPAAFTISELYVYKFSEYERKQGNISGLGLVDTAFCLGQEYFLAFLNEFSTQIRINKNNFDYKLVLRQAP